MLYLIDIICCFLKYLYDNEAIAICNELFDFVNTIKKQIVNLSSDLKMQVFSTFHSIICTRFLQTTKNHEYS